MDIVEYRRKKSEMERQMAIALQKIVREFESDTGLTPNSLSVHVVDKTSIGDRFPSYAVAGVRADVEL